MILDSQNIGARLYQRLAVAIKRLIGLGATPISPVVRAHAFGALAGQIAFSDSFFDSLPDHELSAWEGGEAQVSSPVDAVANPCGH